jgi:GDP-4-dehydro-6-deoxy-D-mannose reductase
VLAAGRVLLIGADGFAGRHLRADAVDARLEVIGTARKPGAGELACDLLDPSSIESALGEAAPALVANLAGAASAAESWADPGASFELNTLGTLNLLEAVAGQHPHPYVLCVSSGDVYGEVSPDELPISEDRSPRPLSPYAASKAAMEVVCGQYARSAGLAIAIVRSFNHFGPGQSERFAASSFARQVAEAEARGETRVTLRVGNVDLERDFTDVRDTVRAYRLLLETEVAGTYNVCSGKPTPVRDLIKMLDTATPLEIEMIVDEDRLRPAGPAVIYGSHQRLTEVSGWTPELPLAGAVGALLDDWRRRVGR